MGSFIVWNLRRGLFLEAMRAAVLVEPRSGVLPLHLGAVLDRNHAMRAMVRSAPVPRSWLCTLRCGCAAHEPMGMGNIPSYARLSLAQDVGNTLHCRWRTPAPVREKLGDLEWLTTRGTHLQALAGREHRSESLRLTNRSRASGKHE